jgi:hypothetical protein
MLGAVLPGSRGCATICHQFTQSTIISSLLWVFHPDGVPFGRFVDGKNDDYRWTRGDVSILGPRTCVLFTSE